MDTQKILYLNGALFASVIALGIVVMLPKVEIPVVTSESVAWLDVQSTQPTVDTTGENDAQYPNFGKKDIFQTLIPRPTPEPTPVPTPVPDAQLTDATSNWAINAVLKNQAFFTDKRSKQEYSMSIGDTIIVPAGRKSIRVVLDAVDSKKFTATFRFDGQQGVQKVTLSAWDSAK